MYSKDLHNYLINQSGKKLLKKTGKVSKRRQSLSRSLMQITRQSLGIREALKGGREDEAITFTKTPNMNPGFILGAISILKCTKEVTT